MAREIVRKLFKLLSDDLSAVQPGIRDEIICPLCMHRFTIDAIDNEELSAEHIVQSRLGGTLEVATVTCMRCNNTLGGRLESHLSKAMEAFDFMSGVGRVRAVIHNDVGHVAGNIDWNLASPVKINIVAGRASNAAGVKEIPRLLRPGNELTLNLNFGFIPNSYWRTLLRIGYLAAFREFGYAYAFSKAAADVRKVLDGDAVPQGVIFEAYPDGEPPVPLIVQQVADVAGVLVLFRLKNLTTRWMAVLLPGRQGCAWDALGNAIANPEWLRARYTFEKFASTVTFRFAQDPIRRLWNLSVPAISPSCQA